MPLKSVNVPAHFSPPFEQAETLVENHFADFQRKPDAGTIRVGGERYVLMRCESLYLGWFDAMERSFGEEAAREFIYNTAREIGRADSAAFAQKESVDDPLFRLASGPVHFAHAGWAFVVIHDDSNPAPNDEFFLHYDHPNTFEAEVVVKEGRNPGAPVCLFSAGYSAGWCTAAYGIELHGREVSCCAKGDAACQFVMAPSSAIAAHVERVTKT